MLSYESKPFHIFRIHKFIDNRHKELGPIFKEKLGKDNCVFMSSASLMTKVFSHEGQHPKHPIPDAWELYNSKHNCQRGLFFMFACKSQFHEYNKNSFLVGMAKSGWKTVVK